MNNKFKVFGREIMLNDSAVKGYQKKTGELLTNKTIENLLKEYIKSNEIQYLSVDTIENLTNKAIYMEMYVPNIFIPIFNDTRTLTIDRTIAMYFAKYEDLNVTMLENYLKWTVPDEDEGKVRFMSNKELSKKIEKIMINILKNDIDICQILNKVHPDILSKE